VTELLIDGALVTGGSGTCGTANPATEEPLSRSATPPIRPPSAAR
jgi:hypothetical protein